MFYTNPDRNILIFCRNSSSDRVLIRRDWILACSLKTIPTNKKCWLDIIYRFIIFYWHLTFNKRLYHFYPLHSMWIERNILRGHCVLGNEKDHNRKSSFVCLFPLNLLCCCLILYLRKDNSAIEIRFQDVWESMLCAVSGIFVISQWKWNPC